MCAVASGSWRGQRVRVWQLMSRSRKPAGEAIAAEWRSCWLRSGGQCEESGREKRPAVHLGR
jgi:hypothetical protein